MAMCFDEVDEIAPSLWNLMKLMEVDKVDGS